MCPVGWTQQRQHIPLISTINSEVALVDGNNDVLWVHFAHSHDTQIRQIGFAVGIPPGKINQSRKVISKVKLRMQEMRPY